ncbi:protein RADIALIS-like 4 isoform X2 [Quercus suber]|uniref:protein RADIALIS-like 4 isoform X2 n=1 Tax=Quercus suber TaxID=58331 RepID=UPI000D2D39E0|nr:transcription factor srm1 [Quercus suber]
MSLAQNISNQSSIGDSSSWSRVQDKVFEEAIVVFPEGTQDRWEKIATQVLGKSPLEVRRHYEVLVHDLLEIDSGRVELPSYEDEFDTVGQGSEYSEGPVDFGSKAKETQRRRGVPWTEEEHREFTYLFT